ncbi:MAG TPA: glycoside hydrolase family 3 C-terminal domain-containing protein [Polyangiaceae bacterium]|jgi:beta-glucosidase
MADFPFQNPELSLETRVTDLVSRLTLAEKATQMLHEAPAIPRLGIPAYNWWNECLHGVARAGVATVFPQAIGLAAIWSERRLSEVATAIADEARAKHHEFIRQGDHGMYKGLTFWSPNINIFRDPRWGRGHETYGECPFLTARLGVAFCKALQGDDPKHLKLVATAKHFAVHSGPEGLRHSFDALASPKDLRETYLPAFHACVTEAKAHSVMSAYNRTNGEPCSASPTLFGILREEWGFRGYIVSDCWAIKDFHEAHHVTKSFTESAALAVKAGCDLNCGCTYEHIPAAIAEGLLSEADLDVCVKRLFEARLRLGMFDPPERVSHAAIPYEVNDSAAHRELSRVAARESLVLLKNRGLLPLSKHTRSIAVIGPNAYDRDVMRANYFGIASETVTVLDGIRAKVSPNTKLTYTDGCKLLGTKTDGLSRAGNLSEAVSVASRADVVVLCLGLCAEIEGEQGDASNSEAAGDKVDLKLTGLQNVLMEQIVALGKPTILVVLSGSALDLSWADEHVGAILQAFYPGQEGGTAIAEVLFGDYNPGGRLPVTFPRSLADLPAFTDYAMSGRTYRYAEKPPLYPFGYGLSYTTFQYSELALSKARVSMGDELEVSVRVKNTGARAGDEVVELYVKDLESSCVVPHHELRGFERIALDAGQSRTVSFKLSSRDLSLIDERGKRVLEPGKFRISVGSSQPDARSVELCGRAPLSIELELLGVRQEIAY